MTIIKKNHQLKMTKIKLKNQTNQIKNLIKNQRNHSKIKHKIWKIKKTKKN